MTKTSLYDFLSMIVPGYLFIAIIVYPEYKWRQCMYYDVSTLTMVITLVMSYIFGMFIHCVSKCFFDKIFRNNTKEIKKQRALFWKNLSIQKTGILRAYYIKYYKTAFASSVPILEAQVSFLKSMVIVILFFIIRLCLLEEQIFLISNCCAAILLLILLAFMLLMMWCRQNLIYYRVWEDGYYK